MGPDHGRSGESVSAPTYPSLVDALRAAVARALEHDVTAQAVVRGGDVAQAFRLELEDGRTVFAKTHPASAVRVLQHGGRGAALARGRRRRARSPRCSPSLTAMPPTPVPRPRVGRRRAARVPRPRPSSAAALARAAPGRAHVLRSRGPAHHGQPGPAERSVADVGRVLRHAAAGAAGPPGARRRRPSRPPPSPASTGSPTLSASRGSAGADEPPARLHGDLWAGNRLVDERGDSWLIDPAAHGGHREFDLAMMRLFGGFGDACFAAYAERPPARRRLGGSRRPPPDRPARGARHQVRWPATSARPRRPSPATP